MKKVLWAVLVTGTSALAATLAARGIDKAWRAIAKEPPPDMPWWARWLVAKPVQMRLSSAMDQ